VYPEVVARKFQVESDLIRTIAKKFQVESNLIWTIAKKFQGKSNLIRTIARKFQVESNLIWAGVRGGFMEVIFLSTRGGDLCIRFPHNKMVFFQML
jgi:hypothetical protein